MQTIKIISGLQCEGKTSELLEEFLNHFNNEEISKNIKPVFITADETYDTIYDMAKNKLGIDVDFKSSVYQLLEMGKDDFDNIIGSIILSNLEKSDCVFYMDGVDNFIKDFDRKILMVMNSFPNQIIKHSFDVVYTVNKLPIKFNGIVESVKK